MRASSGIFVASVSSSVSLSGILFTGGNADHVWFIFSVSARPVSPLVWRFSGFNVGVSLCTPGGFLSKPVTELGCFAELNFYRSLLVSQ